MTVSLREIEKLRAIGYRHRHPADGIGHYICLPGGCGFEFIDEPTEDEAWSAAKAHAQSPEGMKATHSSKEMWLTTTAADGYVPLRIWWEEGDEVTGWFAGTGSDRATYRVSDQWGPTPEAAVDKLFWAVA